MPKQLSKDEKVVVFAKIQELHDQKMGVTRIAHALGKTRSTIHSWMNRGMGLKPHLDARGYRKLPDYVPPPQDNYSKPKTVIENVDRVCLKCREPFVAEGAFNRLCEPCGDSVNALAWAGE